MHPFTKYKDEFDRKYGKQSHFDCFLTVDLALSKTVKIKGTGGAPKEEFYKWQFLSALVNSGMYPKDISVTQKSAWFLLRRLRYAFDHPNFKAVLEEHVEIDETFVGGKNKNRHEDKRVENSQGRSYKDKTPVLGMIQRNGNLITKVVPDTKQQTVEPLIHIHVKKGANVYTDEWHAYNNLGSNYNHHRVNHGAKEYVNFMASTNSSENILSDFKRATTHERR